MEDELRWPDFTAVDQQWNADRETWCEHWRSHVPPGGNVCRVPPPDPERHSQSGDHFLVRLQGALNTLQVTPAGPITGTLMWDQQQCLLCVQPSTVTSHLELVKATLEHLGSADVNIVGKVMRVLFFYEEEGRYAYQALKYVQKVDLTLLRGLLYCQWQKAKVGMLYFPRVVTADIFAKNKRFYPATDGEGGPGEVFASHEAAKEYVSLADGRAMLQSCKTEAEAYATHFRATGGEEIQPPSLARGTVQGQCGTSTAMLPSAQTRGKLYEEGDILQLAASPASLGGVSTTLTQL
ncbi:hypothetical protein CYMTET_40583 [Cymbomonas tetramitiformis]|uniref:Uncharacterized protein n=1 Tax=Cymbomonas tetramitiformis TaxID=36881 RepID=A0AAE0C7P7_9CHLO|nr:hypothetical protein CYMTET_40583 [Cymbomonas tetramitiformis]